jgi:hypothetical protein
MEASKAWRGALEGRLQRRSAAADLAHPPRSTASTALAERDARGEVEGQRHRRELHLVADRRAAPTLALSSSTKVDSGTAWPVLRADVDSLSSDRRVAAAGSGSDLHDHAGTWLIWVKMVRDLALAEGVVERVVDRPAAVMPKRGRGVAVDRRRRAAGRRSAGRSPTSRSSGRLRELLHQLRRPGVELAEIRALERVLVLRSARRRPPMRHVLDRLEDRR